MGQVEIHHVELTFTNLPIHTPALNMSHITHHSGTLTLAHRLHTPTNKLSHIGHHTFTPTFAHHLRPHIPWYLHLIRPFDNKILQSMTFRYQATNALPQYLQSS